VSKTRALRPIQIRQLISKLGSGEQAHIMDTEVMPIITDSDLTNLGMLSTPGSRKFDCRLPYYLRDGVAPSEKVDLDNFIRRLAGAIYRGISRTSMGDMKQTVFMKSNDPSIKNDVALAWQYAVNIVDYQDMDANPTKFSYTLPSTKEFNFFGVENYQTLTENIVQISEITTIMFTDGDDNQHRCCAIAFYNPYSSPQDLSNYHIKIGNGGEKQLIGSPGTMIEIGNYHVLIGGPAELSDSDLKDAFGADVIGSNSSRSEAVIFVDHNAPIEIFNKNHPSVVDPLEPFGFPVDSIYAPFIRAADEDLQRHKRNMQIKIVGSFEPLYTYHKIIPDPNVDQLWTDNSSSSDKMDSPTAEYEIPYGSSSGDPITIRMSTTGKQLRTIGELGDIFTVGSWYIIDGDTITAKPFMDNLSVTIQSTNDEEEQTEGGSGIAAQHYGRFNLSNRRYWGIFDYLTIMDPSSDYEVNAPDLGIQYAIDSDGKLYTHNTPVNDGIDNNFNIVSDEAEEEKDHQLYEHVIEGRININTAPWRVIQSLPWFNRLVDDGTGEPKTPSGPHEKKQIANLAMAIVAYRDKQSLVDLEARNSTVWPDKTAPDYSDLYATDATIADYALLNEGRWNEKDIDNNDPIDKPIPTISGPALNLDINVKRGFTNIAELMHVRSRDFAEGTDVDKQTIQEFDIRKYMDADGSVLADEPHYDSTPQNKANDFHERDILFHRVSNLITVRSDVYTAYILLRYGQNGPQRRYIVVFDRSNVFNIDPDTGSLLRGADTPNILLKQRIEEL